MFMITNYKIKPTIINVFKLQESTYNMRDNNKFEIRILR